MTERNIKSAPATSRVASATPEDIAREKKYHSQEINKLSTSMRHHTAEMRAKMTDCKALYADISDHEVQLQGTMGESESSAGALKTFNEEMEGDFALMKEKPLWGRCVSDFLSAALGENKEVEVSTMGLSEYLATCLAKAAPDVTPPAAAVVGFHPVDNKILKVFHADEAAALKLGGTLRDVRENKASSVAPRVWSVLRSGEADLKNAHGIARDAVYTSICPLKSTKGATFSVVVTGPPPVPDELLEMMCRQAGPLLEQVWKLERVRLATQNMVDFIKRYTMEQHVLVYCNFKEGETLVRPERGDPWKWQPTVYNPTAPDLFELEMKWRGGKPIGVLKVSLGNFTRMDEHLTVLLHTLGDVLLAAIDEIEDLTPGDPSPLSTQLQVLNEFEKARPEAPKILMRESHQQLKFFDAFAVFAEIAHFEQKAVDDQLRAVLTGALCLMGVPRKSLGSWEACKKQFKNSPKCHQAMLDVMATEQSTVTPKDMEKRWAEFNMSIKGKNGEVLLNKALYDRSPVSVQLLIRWVTILRMEHKIEDSIAAENAPPPADPIADKIFDDIDANNDGCLTVQELTSYLLQEFPSTVAHKTLRVLDADQDKFISRDEWRRGWADGQLTDFLAKYKEDNPDAFKKVGKRGKDAMAATGSTPKGDGAAKPKGKGKAKGGKK